MKCKICHRDLNANDGVHEAKAQAGIPVSFFAFLEPDSHLKPVIIDGHVVCPGDVLAELDIVARGKKGSDCFD